MKKSNSSVKKRLFFTLASMKKSRFGKENHLSAVQQMPARGSDIPNNTYIVVVSRADGLTLNVCQSLPQKYYPE
jgi:hypothetical protein